MKKVCFLLVLLLLLTGCGSAGDFEPMQDVYAPVALSEPAAVELSFPEEAGMEVFAGESGRIYLCDGYCIAVETLTGGSIDGTLRQLTGYGADSLTVLQRTDGVVQRYECAWTSAGENGDQVARAVVLDDGQYHYCVSVMADADEAGSLQAQWQGILSSVSLRTG